MRSLPALLAAAICALASPTPSSAERGAFAQPTVRTLTPQESAVVDGLAPVPLVDLNLRPAATVAITVKDSAPVRKVQRSGLGLRAAVYAGNPHLVAPLLPQGAGERAPAQIDFQTAGDSAEAWATMTAAGVPHLRLNGFGDFRADATASWTSRFTLGGSTSREVVLRFVVPPSVVGGNSELEGLAWWRSRLRTDVLVNGFPAWSTEAWRLRADYKTAGAMGGLVNVPLEVLQTFGDPLPFPTDDEDPPAAPGAPSNDSNAGNVDAPSQARVVYLSLGRFRPGQAIELSMVVRGTAYTQASTAGGLDHRCAHNGSRYFCSRATMSVDGLGGEPPRVTLLP